MKRKSVLILLCLVCMLAVTIYMCQQEEPQSVSEGDSYDQAVLTDIKITAGSESAYGVLFDNKTACDLAELLPLRVSLWIPANFAKAFDLSDETPLFDSGERTRQYQAGGLAYWPAGNAVAIFHGTEPEQTAVPVIIIGRLDEGAELFADYSDSITIETIDHQANGGPLK